VIILCPITGVLDNRVYIGTLSPPTLRRNPVARILPPYRKKPAVPLFLRVFGQSLAGSLLVLTASGPLSPAFVDTMPHLNARLGGVNLIRCCPDGILLRVRQNLLALGRTVRFALGRFRLPPALPRGQFAVFYNSLNPVSDFSSHPVMKNYRQRQLAFLKNCARLKE
jgi:hypothetical protein